VALSILLTLLVLHGLTWFVRWEIIFRRHDRLTPRLKEAAPAGGGPWPSVTVFVPVRNEEAGIGAAVGSLLAQDYPNLHIIVANDHSTDRTGEILAELQAKAPAGKLTFLTVPDLPEGWMGKCHALHHAVAHAPTKSDIYLFTDGDVIHAPDTISRAVNHLVSENGDLLAIFPRLLCVGFWENAVLPMLTHLGLLSLNPRHVSDPSRKEFAGVGAFCLIRRRMYETWGGHEAIRGEVLDDMAIGLKTKRAGGRIVIAKDPEAIRLRMYSDLSSIIRGFEKNMHQSIDRGLVGAVVSGLFFPVSHVLPLVIAALALVLGVGGWWLPALALALFLATGWKLVARIGPIYTIRPLVVVLSYPLGTLLAMYIMLRSAWHAEVRGEIHWRGRRLPRPEQQTRLVP
jgi:cellulose synthase/poly-beta-1,6-N-acetylglucosamine synthase-like glycosyltransferase